MMQSQPPPRPHLQTLPYPPNRHDTPFALEAVHFDEDGIAPAPLLKQPVLCLDCTGDTAYDPRDGTYTCLSCGRCVEEVPTPPEAA